MPKLSFKKISHMPSVGGREFIGIDLSGFSLKVVQLVNSLNKVELLDLRSQNIVGLSDDDLCKAIKGAAGTLRTKSSEVISVIPSHLVITKNIEIPSTDAREIKEIIGLQAGRHTPYSREEIIVDYIEIGNYKTSYTKVLLVIVSRSVIKRQFDLLEKAGFKLVRVLLAAEGLASCASRLLRIENENSPAAIVHIEEGFTDFVVTFKNKPVFVRNIPIGTQHIMGDRQNYEARFVEEVRRSLEAYRGEDIEKIPGSLILTGVSSAASSMESSLAEVLHLPVKAVPYLKSLTISPQALKNTQAMEALSFLSLVASLAASDKARVDLVPEEVKLRRALEQRGKDLIKTGIFLLAIFVLLFSILMSKIYFKGAYLKKLAFKYQGISKEAEQLQQNFAQVSLVKNYLSNRGYSLDVLTELYSQITPDLQISDIRFDDQGKFTIRGTAEAMSTVFSFVENLEKSKYFKDVKTKYTTKRKEQSKDLADFEIVSTLARKTE